MQILDLAKETRTFGPADAAADQNEFFSAVYAELRRIASFHIRGERYGQTIQATALVHETFLKLARNLGPFQGVDRQYFLRLASQAMRRILVDRARARIARKRDASEGGFFGFATSSEFVDLHEALERLAALDARQAHIVEMRFFGGMTEDEVAAALGVCTRTVKRDWKLAKAWLFGELAK